MIEFIKAALKQLLSVSTVNIILNLQKAIGSKLKLTLK